MPYSERDRFNFNNGYALYASNVHKRQSVIWTRWPPPKNMARRPNIIWGTLPTNKTITAQLAPVSTKFKTRNCLMKSSRTIKPTWILNWESLRKPSKWQKTTAQIQSSGSFGIEQDHWWKLFQFGTIYRGHPLPGRIQGQAGQMEQHRLLFIGVQPLQIGRLSKSDSAVQQNYRRHQCRFPKCILSLGRVLLETG